MSILSLMFLLIKESMKLKIETPIVSAEWLYKNINVENLIVLDATILKVGKKEIAEEKKEQIPNAIFFDLKNVFLDKEGIYPNTLPTKEYFEEEVKKLGVNENSTIVVYDAIGVYSSPRVWWLFKVFGFENIAVLNGGLPSWLDNKYPVEALKEKQVVNGDFKACYKKTKVSITNDILKASNSKELIFDARSKGRFYATEPEPRADLRGGHIPNSKSLPYSELQLKGKMKSQEELKKIFLDLNPNKEEAIFSCGSGITACILALGSEIAENKNYKVYDGSWTEWASNLKLPIEK